MKKKQRSILYKNTAEKIGLASRVSYLTRKKIYALFAELMKPTQYTSILDVGVTCDTIQAESNFFEKFYPYKEQITCVGTEDGSYLEKTYSGLHFIPINSGQPLPFKDNQFDIVFSNATVEHTGSALEQTHFISETTRVAKSFFITTPNRWFPIEMHTALPLIHYFPKSIYRYIYSCIGMDYWAQETNLNLLDKNSFRNIFPLHLAVKLQGIRTFMLTSNLVVYGWKSNPQDTLL